MAESTGATRKDTFKVGVLIENLDPNAVNATQLIDLEVWDKKTGGEVDSEEYKYSPGGMADSISLGGRKVVNNLVVSRLYKLDRDHRKMGSRLINGVGRARMTVHQLPLDINGNAFGTPPITWNGTLKRVTFPEVDSESSDAALIEIEITVEGPPVIQ